MIEFRMRIVVPREERHRVVQSLRTLIGPTNVRPGCLHCRLYQDIDDETALTWTEEWESRASLDRHVRSNEYRTILSVIDLSTVQPEIRFDTVAPLAGMELIEDARRGVLSS